MTPLSFLNVLSLLVYLTMIILIAVRNPRSGVNRVCVAVFSSLAIWSFADVFGNSTAVNIETAAFLDRVGAVGWLSFASLFVLFCLHLTGRGALARRWYTYAALLLPPAVFLVAHWLGYMVTGYTLHSFGWNNIWSKSAWPAIYYAHYISMVVLGCVLLERFARRAGTRNEALQVRVLLVVGAASVAVASVTNVVLPRLVARPLPEVGPVAGLLWAAGLYYAVTRHGLMSVTPANAAEDILATMADAVLLLDPRGVVVNANRALTDTLGYQPDEITGKPARSLFAHPERLDRALDELLERSPLVLPHVAARRRNGSVVPVSASARLMKTPDDEVRASVWVIRDISREIENTRARLAAEQDYRTFLDRFQGIAFRATHDFQVEFLRGAVKLLTGHAEEDFTSSMVRWRDLIHPEDVERLRAGTAKLKEHPGRSLSRDYRIIRADKAICWVREIVTSVVGNEGSPVHFTGAIFDVSEHRKALDELSSLSQLRESVIDSANVWVSVVDTEMNVLVWNRAAELISGYSRDEAIGHRRVWDRIWPNVRERLPVIAPPDGAIPRQQDVEAVITTRGGEKRSLLFNSRPIVQPDGTTVAFVVLGPDVTQQRAAEESLRESEDKYRTLVEQASDGIAVLQDGLMKFANTRLLDAVGLRHDEVVGHPFVDRISDDARAELVDRYHRRIAGEDVPATFETRLAVKGGRTIDVEVNAAVITYEGRPADLVVIRDITERKQTQEREMKHSRDMAFLSRTAMEFVEMVPSDDIYRFVAERLKELSGATLVFCSSYDKSSRSITIRTALGFGAVAEVAARAIGRDPVGMKLPMPEDAMANLLSGRLVDVPGGLAELSLGAVPKPVCDTVNGLMDLNGGYSIGFAWGGELYGNASLVMRRGSTVADTAAVEAFVRQASIALRRRQDEEARPARAEA